MFDEADHRRKNDMSCFESMQKCLQKMIDMIVTNSQIPVNTLWKVVGQLANLWPVNRSLAWLESKLGIGRSAMKTPCSKRSCVK